MSGSLTGFPPAELRLVLLGTIGCGKTLSGETILGRPASTSPSLSGSSKLCQLRRGGAEGRRLVVVEAPRWYWSGSHVEAGVRAETERALELSVPGPHAFLLLVPVGQFTEVDRRVLAELEEMFGEGVLTHTLVLLTCGDYLMGRGAEQYLQGEDLGFREMIDRCGGRYHVLNNRRPQQREQVRELLEKVENMVQKNGGCYAKNALLREVEERVMERQRELRERVEEEKETVLESGHVINTETQSNARRREEALCNSATGRRGGQEGERDEIGLEERVTVKPMINGLCSTPVQGTQQETQHVGAPRVKRSSSFHLTPAKQNDGTPQVKRSSSFRMTADGALLSQLSEVKPTKRVVNTLHHRITTFGDRPSSSPETPPSSSSPSSPTSSLQTSSPPSSSSSSHPSSSTFPSPPSPPSQPPELRLVLLGRSGAGKSTAGNIILGREEFVSRPDSPSAVTQECEKRRGLVAGRRVALVDTPDWFCSERTPTEVRAQISSCVALAAPGPHVFLLCVPLHRPARAELPPLGALEAVFGPAAVTTHTLVLFTHADRLRDSGKLGPAGAEGYIASQRKDLLKLVEQCGDRFHVLERGSGGEEEEEAERRSAAELIEKVEQTVKEGGGGCYSSPVFREAENRVRQRQAEIVKERRRRRGGGVGRRRGGGQEEAERRALRASMQPLKETEDEEEEEEIEGTRDEAEKSVSAMELESLPSLSSSSSSTPSPSLLRSLWEKVGAGLKRVPKLLAGGALLGGVAGALLGGPLGGAIGAAAGSAVTEVGRRRLSQKKKTSASDADAPTVNEAEKGLDEGMSDEKVIKTE